MSPPDQGPGLRALMEAGSALLLPSQTQAKKTAYTPLDLLKRSSAVVPEWRSRSAWAVDTEVEDIGNISEGFANRRCLALIGRRSLDVLLAVQAWLEMSHEQLPANIKETDLLIGATDIKVLKQLAVQVMELAVLPRARAHVEALRARRPDSDNSGAASEDLTRLLSLLSSRSPASTAASSSRHAVVPATHIIRILVESHLSHLLLATIVLGYTPTSPPAEHTALRGRLIAALSGPLSPRSALNALAGVLRTVKLGPIAGDAQQQAAAVAPGGWSGRWPDYVEPVVSGMMSAQLRRAGGVQALMSSTLGEDASQSSKAAVDDRKLGHISRVLATLPKAPVEPVVYINGTLEALLDLVQPQDGAEAAPRHFVHAASHAVHVIWTKHPDLAGPWLEAYFEGTFRPVVADDMVARCRDDKEPINIVDADACDSSVKTLMYLLDYAPPDRKYASFLIDPILPALLAMYRAVTEGSVPPPPPPAPAAGEEEGQTLPDPAIQRLLFVWAHIVGKRASVQALQRIADVASSSRSTASQSARPVANVPDDLMVTWKKEGTSAALLLVPTQQRLEPSQPSVPHDVLESLFQYLEIEDTEQPDSTKV